ncbi:uncharacterized protein LOC116337338 [Contarinia nasturtii]|uniref:uncharacterized protein LOC116337338 n=1 Tax=Contarinia nasturtii TaxID=265458 RepID=UPI0012D3C17F|nr:uncharacterized protein LOC116337338 [Contarinia nasturtii]
MDDCVTGDETIRGAIVLAQEMDEILKGAGFRLRKWKSNSKLVMRTMDSENTTEVIFSEEEDTTILGLKWLIQEDLFTFVVKQQRMEDKITKRKVVSFVMHLYDPIGLISPVTIKGRIFIQDLWRLKLDWDEELPEDMKNKWNSYWMEIIYLENFTIERWLATKSESKIHLHGFADSGEPALGAVLYVRIEHLDGLVTCQLVTSRSRVAPLKTVSIPRLELSAAELLSRLIKEVRKTMEWSSVDYTAWTDSSSTFHWIRRVPRELKTYVANRVSSIQSNTDIEKWRHISGKDNPADLLTRGISAKDLVDNSLWLHGPDWLLHKPSEWPLSPVMQQISKETMIECKVFMISEYKDQLRIGLKGTKTNEPLLKYTSKLEKAINILSYVIRFLKNWKNRKDKIITRPRRKVIELKAFPPTLEEKAEAMEYLLRKTQQEYFNKEMTAMKQNKRIPEKSVLESLNPILDKDGLIRVGGRIERSELNYEMKHPVIVPHGSRLAKLIADYAHRITKHGGVQQMTQFIRQNYWIPKIRDLLRSIVHKCIVCVRLNARMQTQLMADLPAERTQVGKPFINTGVDFAGPFSIKLIGGEIHKCWIAIFICLKTKGIHIDVVTDMTTVAFIACYERFIARRGRCERMCSDNGTTFVSTNKELKKAMEKWLDKDTLDHLHYKGTNWKFITPAASHQGGIYEAAVKSMKFHLKRIIGIKTLLYENFITLLAQIEAILNSRPLYPLKDDPTDIQALTPGHFLVGEPLILPLPFSIDPKPTTDRIRLWKDRQTMIKHFWQRWKEEYLTSLQERKKWRREQESMKIGQLVVLKSENHPPASWALGRIVELLPSKDGLVRNVIVETATNKFKRAVQKICILPVSPD